MIKLDRFDISILRAQYLHAPDFEEIYAAVSYGKRPNKKELRARLYRLSRHNLCACDKPGMHPGQPRCWSLSPEGERVVEESDEEFWNKPGYIYE